MRHLLTKIKNNYTNNKRELIRTLLISEGFGFCFSLSCVFGLTLDRRGSICASIGMVMFELGMAILLSLVVTPILLMIILAIQEKASAYNEATAVPRAKRIDKRIWFAMAIIFFITWIPVLLAYYPAVFSYDAEAQLYQVISGNYSTHHPLIHTLIMGMCMKIGFTESGIGPGMTLYAVLQMIIMALILGWTVAELKRIELKKWQILLYVVFVALFPVIPILNISTTKDIYFAGLTVLFVMLLRRILMCEYNSRTCELIKLCVVSVLMLMFRNNAQYALVLVIIILGVRFVFSADKKRYDRELIVALTLAVIIAGLGGSLLKSVLHAESGSPREALSIPIQQMARVKVYKGNELDEALKRDLASLIDDEAAQRYDEHLADPVKERISMKQPALFVKTWLKLGMKYPGIYIDAWAATTEGAWYISDKSCNRIYGEGQITGFGYLSTDIRNMPEGFGVYNETKIPWLRARLESIVSDNVFENVPIVRLIFSPAFYFWLLVFWLCKSICMRDKKALVSVLFLVAYYLTILMSPAILVRYMYPYILMWFIVFIPHSTTGEIDDNN